MTLLAALSGCMAQRSTTEQPTGSFGRVGVHRNVPGVVGPRGEPVADQGNGTAMSVRGVSPDTENGVMLASMTGRAANAVAGAAAKEGPLMQKKRTGHVPPPPYAGPPGVVAAVPGALMGGMPAAGTARSSIRFVGQDGMKVAWFAPSPDGKLGFRDQLVSPGRYNFLQGGIYRLRLGGMPRRAGLNLYPTIEVMPQSPKTTTFLAHSAIPLAFTDDDIEQAIAGNLVVKVIYLPDPQYQDLAIAGPDEVVSTKLEPGIDPVQEAQRRGSVLLIVRMGNIDLELNAENSPAMDAGNPYLRPPVPPAYLNPRPIDAPKTEKPLGAAPSTLPTPNRLPAGDINSGLPVPRPSNSVNLPN